ncbi:MAG: cytochrome c oxidase subunit II [Thermoplasmata archaeon]|nr:cytochrome c oxidase subunit II [Candidatus Sysuiplasma acidicola]MBX8646124.1 cytochrome c oxidase subunit II [Candidatus Sysuiplasma acidicola]
MFLELAINSVTSATWLSLFNLYLVVGIPISAFVIGWIIYVVVKNREKGTTPAREDNEESIRPGFVPSSARGKTKPFKFFILFMAVLFLGLTAIALPAASYTRTAPTVHSNTLTIDVYAAQWVWTFHYPNGYNVTGSALIRNYTIVLPVNTTLIFRVTSLDVMHEFSIPSLKVRIDAFPDVWNVAWTNVSMPGTYTVFCTELCGPGHADMWVNIHLVSQSEFASWYAGQ